MGKYYAVGSEHVNSKGLSYTVISESDRRTKSGNKMVRVKFDETGYEYDVEPIQIKRGTVKDRAAKTVLGVGSIGEVVVSGNKSAYSRWHGMLRRCYVESEPRYSAYGGKGVTVSDRWLCFENYVKDMPYIDGYDEMLYLEGKLHLDKDLKQIDIPVGERVYSKETCTFLSPFDNSMLVDNEFKKHYFVAINPDEESIVAHGIKEFCRDNNLTYNSVRQVMNGTLDKHKGWKFFRLPQ